MKVSPAGKLLRPQTGNYRVVYDGSSEPMIATPGGRIFRLQQLRNGQWGSASMDPADTQFFADAANLLREQRRQDSELLAKQLEAQEFVTTDKTPRFG